MRRWAAWALALCLLAPAGAAAAPKPRDLARLEAAAQKVRDHQAKGQLFAARKAAEARLKLADRLLPDGDPLRLAALEEAARARQSTGDHLGALTLYERVLALREAALGPDHPDLLTAIDALAFACWIRREDARAEALYARGMKLRERHFPPDDLRIPIALQVQASLYTTQGHWSRAEALYEQVIERYERHPTGKTMVGGVLIGLAWVQVFKRDLGRAEVLLERVVASFEQQFGKDSPHLAPILLMIAQLWDREGLPAKAAPLYDRVEAVFRAELAAQEAKLGADSAQLAYPIDNLARLVQARRQWDEAEALHRRSLAIHERQAGPDSAAISAPVFALYAIARERGDLVTARAHLTRMQALQERLFGPAQATAPMMLLADVAREQGRLDEALGFARRVRKSFEQQYGPRHPHVAPQIEQEAVITLARGDAKRALTLMQQAQAIQEPAIALVLAAGAEADNRVYMANLAYQLDYAVSLSARDAPDDPAAASFALDTLLRRKGRVLDAVTDGMAALRKQLDPADRQLLEQLAAGRSQLAKLVLTGPAAFGDPGAYAREVARLESDVRRLEAAVRDKSAAYRAQTEPVSIQAVQKALPPGAALLEIARYRPHDPAARGEQRLGPPEYAAYVLGPTGPPRLARLGDAATIDRLVGELREALASPERDDVVAVAQRLYARVMAPVMPLLGQGAEAPTHLVVSPDGALNLVPFGALADPAGRWLVQRFTFSYVTSGRDLLRLGVRVPPKSGPLVVADPDFDEGAAAPEAQGEAPAPPAQTRGRRSRDLRGTVWQPLPATAEEARELAALLSEATVLTGERATETALKQVAGPRLLHVATHGFFLPGDETPEATAGAQGLGVGLAAPPQGGPENPLLRSGLALTAANHLASGEDDGVLTALEAAGLDLWGTQLVVLSACETGVGEVTRGEGVQGLRRALVMAGAESQVMSLWQVDDVATRELMSDYYRRLVAGEGRAEALRQVQLAMVGRRERRHPFYWASFIPAGHWGPLDGAPAPAGGAASP